jgi:hypothetical protein
MLTTQQHSTKKREMQKTKIIIATLFLYRSSLFCNCAFFLSAGAIERAERRPETLNCHLVHVVELERSAKAKKSLAGALVLPLLRLLCSFS